VKAAEKLTQKKRKKLFLVYNIPGTPSLADFIGGNPKPCNFSG
jgi:hypothetical protein